MPKNAIGEPFSLSLVSGIEKGWMRGWGEECQDFPSEISCLTVPRNFVEQPFRVSLNRVSKKLMLKRVMSRFFVEIFCLAVPKNFVGGPFCAVFPKVSGSE